MLDPDSHPDRPRPRAGELRGESLALTTSIEAVKGVGPKLAKLLSKKGISTVEDALYYLPRAYDDRRKITPIAQLAAGQTATVFGRVVASREQRIGKQIRFEATLADATGRLSLFWFRAFPSLKVEFSTGQLMLVHGEISAYAGIPKLVHPEYEKVKEVKNGKPVSSAHFGRIIPIYSETEGLHQKTLRKLIVEVLRESLPQLSEPLPEKLLAKLRLPTLRDSFVQLHFPKELPPESLASPALGRLAFEEFFILQLGLGLKKQRRLAEKAAPLRDEKNVLPRFLAGLPFSLTGDQKNTLDEILADMARPFAMTRLVQGDVGSGKTVVAFAGAAVAAGAGFQTAVMAPTELLAQQHLRTAELFLRPLGIEPLLLSHGTSSKKEIRAAVATGKAQVIVGTHALFQDAIEFQRLGFVVVDEQHRFGVEQRSQLVRKAGGLYPHLLLMTATPIPRTLALTLYGDLDLSLIRQKPAGRQPVKTSVLRERDRHALYAKIRKTVQRGEQVYIIYPLVELSEKLDLKSATDMHARLSREVFPEFSLALLHGKMKSDDKDRILDEFKNAKHQILVSTTVIEVGIDVPNATLMVIEHPDRLGLSQLHQLRGRVGRGKLSSECVLVVDAWVSPRLRVMERSEDGFEIAEEDLKLRGPGEFLGTRQSGLPGFRAGHLLRDSALLDVARDEAGRLLEADPGLRSPQNETIRHLVENRWKEKIERLRGA